MAIYELHVDQLIVFGQPGLRSNEQGCSASNILRMSEKVTVNIKYLNAHNTIFLGQVSKADVTTRNITVRQYLSMWDRAIKGPYEIVTQILAMWDSGQKVLYDPITQTILFHERVDVSYGKGVKNTLILIDQATYNVIRQRFVNQTLNMVSGAAGYLPDSCDVRGSFPFGGVNGTPSEVF